ncbi:hypothetical protein [Rickettsiales endosymbiont of Stachyamoeba lipophora]|uniref:hypothetical protein n=1 Tax=Rickettsiales endosymbiont of Stachyamoeba lipophora TaxID=2486578 RepID=UPI000F650875|nr:hypothetical protein [Rickettsiales endosymbiont of Stachyamoeba lipophora]AZL16278.1 hypothetical protein EF513_07030 [Rickettsiales endosymbiont of Stachyamoeba lipophora]
MKQSLLEIIKYIGKIIIAAITGSAVSFALYRLWQKFKRGKEVLIGNEEESNEQKKFVIIGTILITIAWMVVDFFFLNTRGTNVNIHTNFAPYKNHNNLSGFDKLTQVVVKDKIPYYFTELLNAKLQNKDVGNMMGR